jgi:hypothetical protein
MLIPAIIVLGLVVLAGIWLGGLYMMVERPPDRLRLLGASHAVGGVIGFELLVLALRHTPPSAHAVYWPACDFDEYRSRAWPAGDCGVHLADYLSDHAALMVLEHT